VAAHTGGAVTLTSDRFRAGERSASRCWPAPHCQSARSFDGAEHRPTRIRRNADAGARRADDSAYPTGCSDTTALLAALLGSDPSVGEPAVTIADRAAGNPFLRRRDGAWVRSARRVSRRARWLCGTDVGELSVAATVQAAIEARIDRLTTPAKKTLNAAAVIGARWSVLWPTNRQLAYGPAGTAFLVEALLARGSKSDLGEPRARLTVQGLCLRTKVWRCATSGYCGCAPYLPGC